MIIVGANAGNRNNHLVLEDIKSFFGDHGADAVLLQEMRDRSALVPRLEKAGMHIYRPTANGGADCAVVWNPEGQLRHKHHHSEVMMPASRLNPRGAGAKDGHSPAHTLNWVQFEHKPSNRDVYLGSTHVIPSIYLWPQSRLARTHVQRAANWLSRPGLRLVEGDWNMPPNHKFMNAMRHAHHVCNWHGNPEPTLKRRTVDMAWMTRSDLWRVKDQKTLKTSSDHKALWMRIPIKEKD